VRRYETIFILRSDLGEVQVKDSIKRFEGLVATGGGEMLETDEWGFRELAYRIRNERRGYYVRLDYAATGPVLNEVERNLKISDSVLRYLSVLVDPEVDTAKVRAEIEARLHRAVQITIAAGVGATLGLGALDVLAGRLSPGQLLVFAAYVRGLYGPLRQVSKTVQRTAKASACADRVLEVLEEMPEIQSAPGSPALEDVQGSIRLDHVTFGYTPGKPVLQEVHLDIAPRTTVALVGPTGSGKTTFLNLIPRFYDPLSGEVRIDGMEVRHLDLNSLRRHISYLTQEVVVMGLTVRDNIAYGAIGKKGSPPTEEEIQSAARAAYAHEFIVKLPHGYDTVLGERGTTLSGGQRQRIAIARAFIRDARILLFDEPMTGLDPLAEQAVQRAFANLSRGRTTIVVAHHLSTILHADRILFLEGGRIVEQGSHEQLLERAGAYAEFYRTQWALPTPEPA